MYLFLFSTTSRFRIIHLKLLAPVTDGAAGDQAANRDSSMQPSLAFCLFFFSYFYHIFCFVFFVVLVVDVVVFVVVVVHTHTFTLLRSFAMLR